MPKAFLMTSPTRKITRTFGRKTLGCGNQLPPFGNRASDKDSLANLFKEHPATSLVLKGSEYKQISDT